MSPFDIAVFAVPISLTIAILRGPSGMVSRPATNLAMFPLVQAIVAADAGLIARTVAIVAVANRPFMCFLLGSRNFGSITITNGPGSALASADGADTIHRWEVTGSSGTAAELLRILAMASDRHPIPGNFDVSDRFRKMKGLRGGKSSGKRCGTRCASAWVDPRVPHGSRPPNHEFIVVSPPC
jgi:hypothetical protein